MDFELFMGGFLLGGGPWEFRIEELELEVVESSINLESVSVLVDLKEVVSREVLEDFDDELDTWTEVDAEEVLALALASMFCLYSFLLASMTSWILVSLCSITSLACFRSFSNSADMGHMLKSISGLEEDD